MPFENLRFEKNNIGRKEKESEGKEKEIKISEEELREIEPALQSAYSILREGKIIENPKEFNQICQDVEIKLWLARLTPERKFVFDFISKIYQINNPEILKEVVRKKAEVRWIMGVPSPKNIENLFRFIENSEEFEKILKEEEVRWMLRFGKEENVENCSKICQNPDDFVNLCKTEEVRWLIRVGKEESVKNAFKLYKIKNPEDLKEFCRNKQLLRGLIEESSERERH